MVSMLFVVVAAVAAWVAVGRLASATERALARTEASIGLAVDLAATTAASAEEVEKALAVVGDGLGSTGEALGATQQVSENVRRILGIVDFFDRVDDLNESLVEAEASLAAVEASLTSASASVSAAAPVLRDGVVALGDNCRHHRSARWAVVDSSTCVGQLRRSDAVGPHLSAEAAGDGCVSRSTGGQDLGCGRPGWRAACGPGRAPGRVRP